MATSAVASTASTPPEAARPSGDPAHPVGLYILFGTEMWERFSYYGMRAMLVLYLVQYHGWQPRDSSSVYKWYTSLVYLTPLLGGFLADRFFGLRGAVIAGGILMAVGHFLMAFEPIPIFYLALAFLIVGNGFFKPNISTMVGKLYGKVDPRRDGAFTIFYMGINLGAGMAPIFCGALRKAYGFHAGFTLAGVGMGIGLLTFILGQKYVARDAALQGNSITRHPHPKAAATEAAKGAPSSGEPEDASEKETRNDEESPRAGGIAKFVSTIYPILLMAIGALLPIYNVKKYLGIVADAKADYLKDHGTVATAEVVAAAQGAAFKAVFMPTAFAIIALVMGFILFRRIRGAARDKSTVIFILFLFVVLFWMAFEQAGNTLSLWAEYFTDRNVKEGENAAVYALAYGAAGASVLGIFLPLAKPWLEKKKIIGERWKKLGAFAEFASLFAIILIAYVTIRIFTGGISFTKLMEYSAEEWQSANAFLIVILAPIFSGLWLWLAKKGKEPSTPMKMAIALVFVTLSFVAMTGAAIFENQSVASVAAPTTFPKDFFGKEDKRNESGARVSKLDAGRLSYDESKHELAVRGVLADYVVNEALQMGADAEYVKAIEKLTADSDAITTKGAIKDVRTTLPGTPADFALPEELVKSSDKAAAFPIHWDPATKELSVGAHIDAPTKLKLISAGATSEWRHAVTSLRDKSRNGSVAGFWLFLHFLLATIAELCLSPVGLSMVTKLAPARFASLFMGVWMLASSIAQYVGGTIGETWGEISPLAYFKLFVASSIAGAVILFLLVSPIRKLMHNTK